MKIIKALCLSLLVLVPGSLTFAQQRSPAYIHALEDLQSARWMLEHRPVNGKQSGDEIQAVKQIDGAIKDIQKASIDGRMEPKVYATDAKSDSTRRLHEAVSFLRKAKADITKVEDKSTLKGLRHRAWKHIDDAIKLTEKAMKA
jgi:hypothetical protein